jgi:predicted ATPase
MPALHTITLEGFKSLRRIDRLALGAVNVLIGANGSGKSNFIGAFSFLHALCEGRMQEYVGRAGGADRVLHFGAKTTSTLRFEVSFEGGTNGYEIKLIPTETDALHVVHERVSYRQISPGVRPVPVVLVSSGIEAAISKPGGGPAQRVRNHLDGWRVYHFHDTGPSSPMKRTGDVEDNRALRPDGANLAAFLYRLRAQHPDAYDLIRRTVQQVTPFFDDFRLAPSALNPDKIRLEWKHTRADSYFDAASLSDGTLRFMALATLFLQPVALRPSVLLVDEPELGLHPYAITLLASLVKQASTDAQVILSTQSPMLLDHFAPEDVLVAAQEDGATTLTRLDAERLDAWLAELERRAPAPAPDAT